MKINLVDTNGVTLKTAGTYVEEDLEVGLSESDKSSLVAENVAEGITILGVEGTFKGGGVEIPSVSDISLNNDTVLLSWTAPDITELAEYNPTISYVIQIREHELTTTSTSISLNGYLQEGSNEITVKVKAILTYYDNGEIALVEYSQPEYYIAVLDATTSVFRENMRGAKVGNEVYMFGGYDSNNNNNYAYKSVDIFNLETETMSTIDDIDDSYNYNCGVIGVGTDIYKIAGRARSSQIASKKILKYDTLTNTWSTMSATIPNTIRYQVNLLYLNNYIYIYISDYAYKYDIINDTITTISTQNSSMQMYPSVVANDKIYVSYSKILYEYDLEADTYTSIVQFSQVTTYGVLISKGNYIYRIGNSDYSKTIEKYDIESNTVSTLSKQLPMQSGYGVGIEHNGIFYVWNANMYFNGNIGFKLILE